MGENNEGLEVVMTEMEERERVNNGSGVELGKVDEGEKVRWEDFMPRMVLRVLLVEADDSTRQIITALLRKCNYKVAAISDGLKAWEILNKGHSHIDLILTELDLPSISGYALLTLIMEHDSCKHIPVIIMSSQDSVSMVLKCMLKGAADFFIKPVRKNELKNLWRHVWRRLTTNAVQVSQNLACEQFRVAFENNIATNHSTDNVSTSRKSLQWGGKATDSQDLSLTKSTEETGQSCKDKKHDAEDVKVQKTLAQPSSDMEEEVARINSEGQLYKESTVSAGVKIDEDGSFTGLATEDGSVDQENTGFRASTDGLQLPDSQIAIDLIGGMNEQKCTLGQLPHYEELNSLKSTPELELSLRRCHDSEVKEVDDRLTLNRSSASAFSRYNTNKKSRISVPSPASDLTEIKRVNDSSLWHKEVSASEENRSTQVPQVVSPLSGVMFDGGVWTGFTPMFISPKAHPSPGPAAKTSESASQIEDSPSLTSPLHSDQMTLNSTVPRSSGQGHGLATRESVECCGYSISQVIDQIGSSSTCDNFVGQHKISANGHSSSQVIDQSDSNSPCGDSVGQYKINASGHRSSQIIDQGGSSTPCNEFSGQFKVSASASTSEVTDGCANPQGVLETSAKAPKDENCNAFDLDQFKYRTSRHSAEREAALTKFRLKRKGRCFEKKVRYQSRKKLAEQRPRVKGQFVRQVATEQVLADDDKRSPTNGKETRKRHQILE